MEEKESLNGYNKDKKLNSPQLLTGMTPIKFIMPIEWEEEDTAEEKMKKLGEAVETDAKDEEWYDYGTTPETRKWANAETEDDSMWVWIPRYAYKITYYEDANETTVSDEITQYGKIDVKFLIGKTDFYYDENGEVKKAKRVQTANQSIDTTADYTVHPAFTDERELDFYNGGWDKELTGIWVAKFEAGYAGGNNNCRQVDSTVTYSNETTNYYGTCTTSTNIKYPVFMPTTYSINNISVQDAYKISKALTGTNNIYGLKINDTDSHLIKNSEWGAVAYLSKSSYGKVSEVTINNANLNNSVSTIYAITGCTSNSTNANAIETTVTEINNVSENTSNAIYTWNQVDGQNASTTGNIYGIYDMSGGVLERTAAFISNEHTNLTTYAQILKNEVSTGINTKYITTYQFDATKENESGTPIESKSKANYAKNNKIGDAVKETSIGGYGCTGGWTFADVANYPSSNGPLFFRGGSYEVGDTGAGIFAYDRDDGTVRNKCGFRAVLVKK